MLICERKISFTRLNYIGHVRRGAPKYESLERRGIRVVKLSFFNNRIAGMFWDLGASGVGSKVWVLTIRVLEVNPEVESIRGQRGRFSRV